MRIATLTWSATSCRPPKTDPGLRKQGSRVRRRDQVRPERTCRMPPDSARPGVRRLRADASPSSRPPVRQRQFIRAEHRRDAVGTGSTPSPSTSSWSSATRRADRPQAAWRRAISLRPPNPCARCSTVPAALRRHRRGPDQDQRGLRLMSSGRTGFAEITLPAVQPAADHAGKVNPVMAEWPVDGLLPRIGNDTTIAWAASPPARAERHDARDRPHRTRIAHDLTNMSAPSPSSA